MLDLLLLVLKNNKMNKKNSCFLSVIILFTLFSFSQKKGGEIIYKIESIKNIVNEKTISKSDIERKTALNFMNESLNLNVSKFSFRLKFNTTESTFKLIDVLESDSDFDKGYKMAKILSQADNSYYTDKETNIRIISKNAYGKDVKIKSFLDFDKWILTNNTKKIGAYLCNEATTILEVQNNKGIFKKVITAWYTLDIPYNFGPKGYGSLPGLILELSEGSFKYFVSKIKLNTLVKIEKPSEINLIKQEELDSIGKERTKKRNN